MDQTGTKWNQYNINIDILIHGISWNEPCFHQMPTKPWEKPYQTMNYIESIEALQFSMTCFKERHRSFCALRLGTAPREAPSTAPAALRRAELFGAAAAKAARLFGLAFTRNGNENDHTMSLYYDYYVCSDGNAFLMFFHVTQFMNHVFLLYTIWYL